MSIFNQAAINRGQQQDTLLNLRDANVARSVGILDGLTNTIRGFSKVAQTNRQESFEQLRLKQSQAIRETELNNQAQQYVKADTDFQKGLNNLASA